MKLDLGGAATGPLRGIQVLDLSTIVSGPYCTQILGDLGADVVKVETAIGDTGRFLGGARRSDMTGFFVQFNRNKRSVVLDLKSEAGADAFRALAASADVVVENFRPQVMERLGLGEAALRAANPKLVYVSISGFGPDGPYAEQPAYDMVIQALSGFSKQLGTPEKPQLIRNIVADKTGGMTAAYATMAALFERERNGGKGQRIDVPMLDAFAAFVLPDAYGPYMYGDPTPEDPSVAENLFRAWETADGHVAIVVIEDHQFQGCCRAIGRPDLAEKERYANIIGRMQHAGELFPVLGEELAKRTTAELVEAGRREGAPIAPVNDIEAFLADPQAVANEILFEMPHPEAGTLKAFRSPARFADTPSNVRHVPPNLGQHTEEVLREAGLDDAAIAKVRGG